MIKNFYIHEFLEMLIGHDFIEEFFLSLQSRTTTTRLIKNPQPAKISYLTFASV